MTPIARLAAISLDGPDPASLAEFYRELLDLEVFFESDDFIALKGAGVYITTQRVMDQQPPDWPSASVPKQMHLELAVKADPQPNPDLWRVLVDPAGHPFCITTLIPEG